MKKIFIVITGEDWNKETFLMMFCHLRAFSSNLIKKTLMLDFIENQKSTKKVVNKINDERILLSLDFVFWDQWAPSLNWFNFLRNTNFLYRKNW